MFEVEVNIREQKSSLSTCSKRSWNVLSSNNQCRQSFVIQSRNFLVKLRLTSDSDYCLKSSSSKCGCRWKNWQGCVSSLLNGYRFWLNFIEKTHLQILIGKLINLPKTSSSFGKNQVTEEQWRRGVAWLKINYNKEDVERQQT